MPSPRELNPPALMVARLGFASHIGLAIWGMAVAVGATIEGRGELLVEAAIALALSTMLWGLLRRARSLEACRASLDDLFAADADEDVGTGDPCLDALLARRAMLERLRGSPAFDPWALLALQHDIEEHLRTHPKPERFI